MPNEPTASDPTGRSGRLDGELFPDSRGKWTTRITAKYVRGPAAAASAESRAADERLVICLRPTKLVAVASV